MLAELDAIQVLADEAKGLHTGRVKLACFPSVFQILLPSLLRTFRRLHPGIELLALEASDEEVEAWLTSNAIDLGVVMNPAPSRNAVPLGRDEWVVVASTQHHFARREHSASVEFEELAKEPFILATGGCVVNGKSLAEDAGLTLEDLRVTVRDWSSAYTLVRENMGVTLVPELTLTDDRRGLRILSLAKPVYRYFGLICSEVGERSHAVAAFLEVVSTAQNHLWQQHDTGRTKVIHR